MRPEDIKQIRKRIDPTLDSFHSIYGCYVNGAKEIVATMELPVLDMDDEERELYAAILKNVLSGTQGRNIIDIEFPIDKVGTADEHRLLMALKETQLRDGALRQHLYDRVIESLNMDGDNYVILLGADTCDLQAADGRYKDGSGESTEQFEYFICAICPVKASKAVLQYVPGQGEFRGVSTGSLIGPPAVGFMFPSLNDGAADIYQTAYYTKSAADNHGELISGLFMIENPPMAADVQKETFNDTLADALGGECSLDVITSIQARLSARAEEIKELNAGDVPEIDLEDIQDMLTDKGVSDSKVKAFGEAIGERFDGEGTFNINNIIQKRSFEVRTTETKIVTDPENALRIKTRTVDGVTYILVPAGDSVTVNGVEIAVLLS